MLTAAPFVGQMLFAMWLQVYAFSVAGPAIWNWLPDSLTNPAISRDSSSLSPVSPPDNIFALPAEVFLSCLAIVSAVMARRLFLWPSLRYGTGYQTV